jgi:predicted RNA-binding Zn-ribbon protein involved in translation (DUF1610 family)
MQCPKCGSSNVVHKDHDHEFNESSHRVKHQAVHQSVHALKGHPTMFIITVGVWLASKAMQKLAKPWQCKGCGHLFD